MIGGSELGAGSMDVEAANSGSLIGVVTPAEGRVEAANSGSLIGVVTPAEGRIEAASGGHPARGPVEESRMSALESAVEKGGMLAS
jgi:hypothetical protein